MKAIWTVLFLVFLAACAAEPTFVQLPYEVPSAKTERIYYATMRNRVESSDIFGPDRAETLSFGQLDVSIPPSHKVGAIEWPDRKPDSARHFVVTRHASFSGSAGFRSQVEKQPGPVTLFVHGYNTSFPEAVFRHAQIAHDYELKGTQIQFSWPSSGVPSGYLYDRDSVLAARDTLSKLIVDLASDQPGQLTIVGHSMGGFLVMEALRQLGLTAEAGTLARLNRVILISPDVDEAAFMAQLEKIKPRPSNMTVVVNSSDLLLAVSGRLSGGAATRIGAGRDQEVLRAQGIKVVDLSGIDDGDSPGHFLAATSPTAIAFLRSLAPIE